MIRNKMAAETGRSKNCADRLAAGGNLFFNKYLVVAERQKISCPEVVFFNEFIFERNFFPADSYVIFLEGHFCLFRGFLQSTFIRTSELLFQGGFFIFSVNRCRLFRRLVFTDLPLRSDPGLGQRLFLFGFHLLPFLFFLVGL